MNAKPQLNIKALRKARNLTQCELAQRANLPQSKISRYEKGKVSPRADLLIRLATALGVEIGDLFSPVDPSAN